MDITQVMSLLTGQQDRHKKRPLCLVNQYLDLARHRQEGSKKIKALVEEQDALQARMKQARHEYFDALNAILISHGLTTKKEIDACCGLEVSDDVVFICEGMEN